VAGVVLIRVLVGPAQQGKATQAVMGLAFHPPHLVRAVVVAQAVMALTEPQLPEVMGGLELQVLLRDHLLSMQVAAVVGHGTVQQARQRVEVAQDRTALAQVQMERQTQAAAVAVLEEPE
jgi:hypothetical protein